MSGSNDQSQKDHGISLEKAVELVTRFRTELGSIVQPGFENALPFSETFSKDVFESLVQQSGALGVRAYLGLDEAKQVRLLFVATNEKGEDILPDSGGSIYEYGQRCPPICSAGVLNPTT